MSKRAIYSNVEYTVVPMAEEPEIYTFSSSDTDETSPVSSLNFSKSPTTNISKADNETKLGINRLERLLIDRNITNRLVSLEEKMERLECENSRLIMDNKLIKESMQILLASNTELRTKLLTQKERTGRAVSRKKLKSKVKREKILYQENTQDINYSDSVYSSNNDLVDDYLNRKTEKSINAIKIVKDHDENLQTMKNISIQKTKPEVSHTPQLTDNIIHTGVNTKKIILGRTGTVRGFERSVKNRISNFNTLQKSTKISKILSQQIINEKENKSNKFPGKIVIYTSSLTAVRDSFEKCRMVQQILRNRMVKFEEKDIYLAPEYGNELKERLAGMHNPLKVPVVFLKGELLGGADKIVELNENGSLDKLLIGFEKEITVNCNNCMNKRFIICPWCKGSKKGMSNSFGELKCTACNVNGLQVCTACFN